jgi:DNA invertase Pin-like site-specific DNA recombinase
MQIGYMRVSSESDRQTTELERDALPAAGVDSRHLFEDYACGAKDDRPGLVKALAFVQPGDVLVVWKLNRLGRSLSHLLSIVNALKEKQVHRHHGLCLRFQTPRRLGPEPHHAMACALWRARYHDLLAR